MDYSESHTVENHFLAFLYWKCENVQRSDESFKKDIRLFFKSFSYLEKSIKKHVLETMGFRSTFFAVEYK